MTSQLDPAQLAIEFLRRDKTELSPAQYLKRLKQLELEFAAGSLMIINQLIVTDSWKFQT